MTVIIDRDDAATNTDMVEKPFGQDALVGIFPLPSKKIGISGGTWHFCSL